MLRGRWDIARQIKRRPGVPMPAEIIFDDFTEDIEENCLDTGGRVRMRPDIVLRRGGRVVGIADTKYKNRSDSWKSPPNEDIYQALAYAAAAGLDEAHLIYVAEEIEPATFEIASLGTMVVVYGIDISGDPSALDTAIGALAGRLERPIAGQDIGAGTHRR